MKTLFLFSVVPLAFIAPLLAVTMVLALLATYGISIRQRAIDAKLMVEAHHAEARRKANLSYQI